MQTLPLLPSPELLKAEKLVGGHFWNPLEDDSVGISARLVYKGKKCVCVYNIFTCIGYIFIVDFVFFSFYYL